MDNVKDFDLGRIKVGGTSKVYVDVSKWDIIDIEPTCDCDNFHYDKHGKILEITKKGSFIPFHLKHKNEFIKHKKFRVKYKNGIKGLLNFFFTIYKD